MLGIDPEEPSEELAAYSINGKSEIIADDDLPQIAHHNFVVSGRKPNKTIMLIGDSFTFYHFPPLLLQNVNRVVFINHRRCGFNWKWIDAFHPDEVWWMPTERFMLCEPAGMKPIAFTGSSLN